MKVTFWGTRGSIAAPGPATVAYGGDTSCVAIVGDDPSHLLILDAGSGIRELGRTVGPEVERIDLLSADTLLTSPLVDPSVKTPSVTERLTCSISASGSRT